MKVSFLRGGLTGWKLAIIKPKSISNLLATGFVFIPVVPMLAILFFSGLNYLDELVFLVAIIALLTYSTYRKTFPKSFVYTVLVALLFATLSLLVGQNESPIDILAQAVLQSKFFIFCIVAALLIPNTTAVTAFKIILAISFVGLLFNIVSPDFFFGDLRVRERYRFEYLDLARMGGFQLNPNRLGHLFALIAFTNKDMLKVSKRTFRILLIMGAVGVLLSGGRVSMAMYALGLGFLFLQSRDKIDSKFISLTVIVIPLFLYVAFYGLAQLGLLTSLSDEVMRVSFRLLLLTEGIKLGIENFPIGTGLATYGTPFALDAGVYEQTRIGSTFFLEQATALFDNNFAAIIGETGFLGLLVIFWLLWVVVLRPLESSPFLFKCSIAAFIILSLAFESLLNNSICAASFALYFAVAVGYFKDTAGDGNDPRSRHQWSRHNS